MTNRIVLYKDRFDVYVTNAGDITISVGNLSPAMGARNQVGIGLSYRPASLCSLATQFQTRFLESIPRPIAGLKFSTQDCFKQKACFWAGPSNAYYTMEMVCPKK